MDEDGYIKTVPGHTTTNVPGRKGWDIGEKYEKRSKQGWKVTRWYRKG